MTRVLSGAGSRQVDPQTGQRLQQTGQTGQTRQRRPCEERARRLAGTDRQPACEPDGTFSARQCRGEACSCVDPAGNQLPYRSRPEQRAACREYTSRRRRLP